MLKDHQVTVCSPDFISQDFNELVGEIVILRRYDISGDRHYRHPDSTLYRSLTTTLEWVMKRSKYLEEFRESLTNELGHKDLYADWMETVAEYGTILHKAAANHFRNKGTNWMDFEVWAYQELKLLKLSEKTTRLGVESMMNDFACFLQFFYDYDVKVMAIELPVWHSEGTATLIDLIVNMKQSPKSENRINAIINLKSGKKGFFEAHKLQLIGEKKMFENVFPMVEIGAVLNLAPNDFRDTPTYKVKKWDITENDKEKYDALINLARIEGAFNAPNKKFRQFEGDCKVGEDPSGTVTYTSYQGLIDGPILNSSEIIKL